METKDRMLSTEELAEFLNVKPWTVKYKLVKNGMPHYRIGRNGQGHFRFLLNEVLPWLKEGSLTMKNVELSRTKEFFDGNGNRIATMTIRGRNPSESATRIEPN